MINLAYILFALALILGLAPAAFGGLRNARGLFVAYGLLGIFIPFGIAIINGRGAKGSIVDLVSSDGIKAFLLCSIGFVVTIAVSLFSERKPLGRRKIKVLPGNSRFAIAAAIVSILLSVSYVIVLASRLGGLSGAISSLYQRASLADSAANFSIVLGSGGFVFAVFAATFARGQKGLAVRFAAVAAVACLAVSLMSGGRTTVGLFILAVFYTPFLSMSRARSIVALLTVALLFSAVSFAMVGLRQEAQGASAVAPASTSEATASALTGLTYVDHVAASIEYARVRGHDFGALYFRILLQPIPRDLWPDKPLQMNMQLADFIYGRTNAGNPPGIFGEAYIAFGSIGVLAVAVVLGFMLGQVDSATAIALRYDCRLRSALVGIFAPLVAFVLVRGGFDLGVMRLGIPALWCVIATVMYNKMIKRSRSRVNLRRNRKLPRRMPALRQTSVN